MFAQVEKMKENKSKLVANSVSQKKSNREYGISFVDNRPEAKQTAQLQAMMDNRTAQNHPIKKKQNNTGLLDNLKSGIENLSGYSMDVDKPKENKSKSVANSIGRGKNSKQNVDFSDRQQQAVTQRKLQMDGVDCTSEEFITALNQDITIDEELRIEEWERSPLVHNFKNFAKKRKRILANLKNTSVTHSKDKTDGKLIDVPLLYQENYYKHSTKDPGREATLYFDDGAKTGRLRQQHPTGPLAMYDASKKKRVGVTDDDNWTDLREEIEDYGESLTTAENRNGDPIPVNDPPKVGDHHFEFNEGSDGTRGKHFSGGTVEKTNPDNDTIEKIYDQIAPF